ncbi:MAG TPA: PAS-domain containing protein [Xanthobacteraceae bacterium]|nr:PAS-domain containing protein [Xanthobacteraceae bacterium]
MVAAAIETAAGLYAQEVAVLAVAVGLILFGIGVAALLVRIRARAAEAHARLIDDNIAVRAERDRALTMLLSEPQVVVTWAAAGGEPSILGDTSLISAAALRERVLVFGSWLEPDKAQAMERAVAALRESGEAFSMALMTLSGRAIEADGRAIGGCAVLRLRDVTGSKRELAEVNAKLEKLAGSVESLRNLIEALPAPLWVRDVDGSLLFVNAAYVRAVEAKDAADAVTRGIELLERANREEARSARAAGKTYAVRAPAIVAGSRRTFDVIDVPSRKGSAGIAIDVTEEENLRRELQHMFEAHRRTLDQLATGVAIFGADRKLEFYNAAYRLLWDLDVGFLDQAPSDSEVLERLRAERKLPEEQDFRAWKAALHEAYRATESKEQQWFLPDGRTLRVVTTPNPQGGVIYLFDDVTERIDLARRYDVLIRVQRETLDNLVEAIAVFGSDGRMRLHNPAFARMWRLDSNALAERPHVEAVISWCRMLYGDDALWQRLRTTVTAIDERTPVSGRLERKDGSVVDLTTVPLPDGATLVAFFDVTDTVNVERALRERNEALEAADKLKINFVHHVSYELRSPLTNIIGFAHFLREPATGPLTEKQKEYLGYITASTNALLAIINDILDLATIDAGAMTLNIGPVDIRRTMLAAAEGVRDRLVKDAIKLEIKAAPDIGSFPGDERRVRQVLFNLLSNAVGFSPAGETVTLAAERRGDAIVFSVHDRGPGIPQDLLGRIFDRFESHPLGSRHRGAGLGLSIVRSFVELHGGKVEINSAVGRGTTVICTFPLEQAERRTAA